MRSYTPAEEPPKGRLLTPDEAARVKVTCALCGADLFPVGLGHEVEHDCETGEVTPTEASGNG